LEKLFKILNKFFGLLLILVILVSSNGILVFKHICNSTNSVKFYFYVNERCSNEKDDSCCSDDITFNTEESCCEISHNDCEMSHQESESQNLIKSKECCFDESYIFSVNADMLNNDKITKLFFLSIVFINHNEKLMSEPDNLYLSDLRYLLFSPPISNIISYIHKNSSEKSPDSHLS